MEEAVVAVSDLEEILVEGQDMETRVVDMVIVMVEVVVIMVEILDNYSGGGNYNDLGIMILVKEAHIVLVVWIWSQSSKRGSIGLPFLAGGERCQENCTLL
jgi:hypothetical protein